MQPVPQQLCFAPAWVLEARADVEAFVDLARGVFNTNAREIIVCPQGHEDHTKYWFEPDARVIPVNLN